MDRLIPLINSLQDVFSAAGSAPISLPQIVVVGSQSSGKSSVLESFVGRDFLPRGTGIVTRRPLILQLHNLSDPSAYDRALFLHRPETEYTDFREIQEEIIAETERVTRGRCNICPDPITLKLWSPRVLNLTVVDLPGIVRNAVDGQDPRIVEEIQKLVRRFIEPKTALILAVSPATEDLANSDALRAAREVDPNGDRTIGVVTKLDLMDAGTDAYEVLTNQVVQLRHGFIGVVNRSQLALNQRMPMEEARRREREFFMSSPHYSGIADWNGSEYLCQRLGDHLKALISESLPDLRTRVKTQLEDLRAKLRSYGEQVSPEASRVVALDAISRYMEAYEDLLRGEPGGRIAKRFSGMYERERDEVHSPQDRDLGEVFAILKRLAGIKVPLFRLDVGVQELTAQAVEGLRQPSVRLVEEVAELLRQAHESVDRPEVRRFSGLREVIESTVNSSIDESGRRAVCMIDDLIECEKGMLLAPPKEKWHAEAADPRQRPQPEKPRSRGPADISNLFGTARRLTQSQEPEIKEIVAIATDCFGAVRDRLKDLIPKVVVRLVVKASGEMIRFRLTDSIFQNGEIAALLQEDPRITESRAQCRQEIETLTKAETILANVMVPPADLRL
jgi:dynamin 1-like protein